LIAQALATLAKNAESGQTWKKYIGRQTARHFLYGA
jgi:hypothetical protein